MRHLDPLPGIKAIEILVSVLIWRVDDGNHKQTKLIMEPWLPTSKVQIPTRMCDSSRLLNEDDLVNMNLRDSWWLSQYMRGKAWKDIEWNSLSNQLVDLLGESTLMLSYPSWLKALANMFLKSFSAQTQIKLSSQTFLRMPKWDSCVWQKSKDWLIGPIKKIIVTLETETAVWSLDYFPSEQSQRDILSFRASRSKFCFESSE